MRLRAQWKGGNSSEFLVSQLLVCRLTGNLKSTWPVTARDSCDTSCIMFCLSRPSRNEIDAFLLAQQNATFSYADVGYSRQQTPRRYVADRNRIALGKGAEAFERAKSAVRNWKMFDMPWVQLCWPNTPLEPGVTVAVLISHLGF